MATPVKDQLVAALRSIAQDLAEVKELEEVTGILSRLATLSNNIKIVTDYQWTLNQLKLPINRIPRRALNPGLIHPWTQ